MGPIDKTNIIYNIFRFLIFETESDLELVAGFRFKNYRKLY